MSWIEIGKQADFPIGSASELVISDRVVAVFNVDGHFYALDGVCPHQGGPLGKGRLSGCVLTCPWHGWQFDVQNGQSLLSQNVRQPKIEIKVESGQVCVRLEP